jgi:hypothetical protein
MARPTLFIGSSTESKWIAEQIHLLLADEVDVTIWDHYTFYLGDYPLESLRRKILSSDFALLIASPDDKLIKRQKTGYTARDNIFLELGLFMGVLGQRRAFYLSVTDRRGGKSKEVSIPSDLAGIMRLRITLRDDENQSRSDLRSECIKLKDAMKRKTESWKLELSLLPSTALAIGYFYNFVLEVCQKLSTESFKSADKDYDMTSGNFIFNIVLPDKGRDASHEMFTKFVNDHGLQKIVIEGKAKSRTFPFYVDSISLNGTYVLYDYPTTLRAAREAVEIASPEGTTMEEIERLERREIENFMNTLRRLLETRTDAGGFRYNVRIISVSNLEKDNS